MGKIALSNDLGKKVCEALGIDPNGVRRMVLTLEAGEPAQLEMERFVHADTGVETVFKQYELREKDLEVTSLADSAKRYVQPGQVA